MTENFEINFCKINTFKRFPSFHVLSVGCRIHESHVILRSYFFCFIVIYYLFILTKKTLNYEVDFKIKIAKLTRFVFSLQVFSARHEWITRYFDGKNVESWSAFFLLKNFMKIPWNWHVITDKLVFFRYFQVFSVGCRTKSNNTLFWRKTIMNFVLPFF